jgi:hemerythrin-like domain-containing protein
MFVLLKRLSALFMAWYTPQNYKQKRSGKHMRISKNLRADQEKITRFLNVLGSGAVMLSTSRLASPNFFIRAHVFIMEFIEEGFFLKEEFLMKALEEGGFPSDEGPIAAMKNDQKKSHAAAEAMLNFAKQWQAGDEVSRSEMGWASSEYTSTIRQHLERLKNLIFPLLEQTISIEEEHRVSESINGIIFEGNLKDGVEKYVKLIETLEDQLGDWK